MAATWMIWLEGHGRRLWRDTRGQDLLEYALIMAFMVITVAAILPPSLTPAISGIFSRVVGIFAQAP